MNCATGELSRFQVWADQHYPPTQLLPAGFCQVCGCSEVNACPDGCAWFNTKKTICTTCAPVVCAAFPYAPHRRK